tara:strand:+ start:829 stop:936 length:108 start_codon:yes stop_codon:yes gene_type:complete
MTGVDAEYNKNSKQVLIGLKNNKFEFQDDLAFMTH